MGYSCKIFNYRKCFLGEYLPLVRSLSNSKSFLHVDLSNTVMECFIERFTLTKSEGKKSSKSMPVGQKKYFCQKKIVII